MRVIRGKKALVTGAASGLGRVIAQRLAQEGADLYLMDVDQSGLAEVVREIRELGVDAIGAPCDVAKPRQVSASIQTMLKTWGYLDILVNNAGVAYYGPTLKMTDDQWNWVMDINLHAPIQFTRELLPVLLSRPEAHILNMASISGLVAGGRFCAYHVSKFGLVGFSEAIRAEFGRQGLGVSAVCPGPVRTNLYRSAPCGHPNKETPTPPAWICASPNRVADKAIRAIRHDKRLVLVSPIAYTLYYANRWSPGLLDFLQRIGRRRKMKRKAAALAAQNSQQRGLETQKDRESKTKAA